MGCTRPEQGSSKANTRVTRAKLDRSWRRVLPFHPTHEQKVGWTRPPSNFEAQNLEQSDEPLQVVEKLLQDDGEDVLWLAVVRQGIHLEYLTGPRREDSAGIYHRTP